MALLRAKRRAMAARRPAVVQGTLVRPVQGIVHGTVVSAPQHPQQQLAGGTGGGRAVDDDQQLAAALAESARIDAEQRRERREKQRRERLQVEVTMKTSEGQRSGTWGSPRPVQGMEPASIPSPGKADAADGNMAAALEASRASHQRRRRAEAQEKADMEAALRASLDQPAAVAATAAVAAAPVVGGGNAAVRLDRVAAAHNLTAEALRDFCKFFDIDPDLTSEQIITVIARGATAPLPSGWREVEDPATGQMYYVAPNKKDVSWSHPTDAVTRDTIRAMQAEARGAGTPATPRVAVGAATPVQQQGREPEPERNTENTSDRVGGDRGNETGSTGRAAAGSRRRDGGER